MAIRTAKLTRVALSGAACPTNLITAKFSSVTDGNSDSTADKCCLLGCCMSCQSHYTCGRRLAHYLPHWTLKLESVICTGWLHAVTLPGARHKRAIVPGALDHARENSPGVQPLTALPILPLNGHHAGIGTNTSGIEALSISSHLAKVFLDWLPCFHWMYINA